MRFVTLPLILLLCVAAGCANYEFDVVRPQDSAKHVGKSEDAIVKLDPLEYRLRTIDGRLVIRIFNPTDDNVSLLGDRSSVVAPDGQSHPLQSQSIAPNSYGKLILPPQRPQIERTGPSFGIGFGTVIGDRRRFNTLQGDTFDEPRYFTIVDDSNLYWNWDGESQVRIRLFYDRNGRNFSDEMVIARKKM
jgi:hypothetical protein